MANILINETIIYILHLSATNKSKNVSSITYLVLISIYCSKQQEAGQTLILKHLNHLYLSDKNSVLHTQQST